MKRLLVLGATLYQIQLINRAREKNCRVIVMDNVPTNPAHRYAHDSAFVSIADSESVLDFAETNRIEGIITGGSDIGLSSLGLVCDTMELPGPTHQQCVVLSRKDYFRNFQLENRFVHPSFHILSSFDDLLRIHRDLTGPYVLKPVDRSGSKGVSMIDFSSRPSRSMLHRAFEFAYTFSFAKQVILEQFINGTEYGGDAFFYNGGIVCFCPTNKLISPEPYFVPCGHTIPSRISKSNRYAIRTAITKVAKCLSYMTGPINFDVIVNSESEVYILEMSPRFGGNCIPQVIEHGAGFDIVGAALAYALGDRIEASDHRRHEDIIPTGVRIISSPRDGKIRSITPVDKILQIYGNSIVELKYDVEVGSKVRRFTQGNHRCGHVIATHPDLNRLEALLDQIEVEVDMII